jgi:CBS domain-containing protein
MFDAPVGSVMKRRSLLTAPPDILVAEAAKRMKRRQVGALIVVDGHEIVGIFTERDIVFRVVAAGLDARATRVREVMTRAPITIGPDEPFAHALLIMHEHGFRHIPVLESGKVVGIVSSRSAMDPDLEEFASEANRRAHFLKERGRTLIR